MFSLDDHYPEAPGPPLSDEPVTDLEEAWYALRSDGLFVEIRMEGYSLPAFGLAYIEFARFVVLPLAESLRDGRPLLPVEEKTAARAGLRGLVYQLMLGEHMNNIPLLLFAVRGETVQIYTRTLLEGVDGDNSTVGVLAGRDLVDPVVTTPRQVVAEVRRFLIRHLEFYRSVFPEIERGEVYQEFVERVAALELPADAPGP